MTDTFQISDNAARRISKLIADEPAAHTRFRISVLGGGCSGFQYKFDLDAGDVAANDILIQKEGAEVVIDDISLGLLKGSMIDFVEDLSSAGFEIKNPNATASCGCGNSFSVM